MLLQRTVQIAAQGQFGGAGEKAGGAGDAAEGPQRAGPARQVGVAGLEPKVGREPGREQEPGPLNALQETGQCLRRLNFLIFP
jgi:hypothetical protein